MFPKDIAKDLRIVFLYSTSGGCFWQSYHGTVKSPGVSVLWFRASTCFRFWNNFFLAWIDRSSAFNFRISFGKTLLDFDFDGKLTQSAAKVTTRVKRLSSRAVCGWSGGFSFRVWFGKRNMAVKIPILILFHFCLLFWLKKHLRSASVVAASCFNNIDSCR